MKHLAMITGVTGQDGSYLSELLLKKGYNVIGLLRRSSTDTTGRLKAIKKQDNFVLLESDLCDSGSINYLVNRYKPDEVYNLAAQSHVKTSFDQPAVTFQINTLGTLNFLEAIRSFSQHSRFYQASTSEMFGSNYTANNVYAQITHTSGMTLPCPIVTNKYQDEQTAFAPNSPYAVAKLAAHNLVDLYRKSYDLHASCGILFNHESERRGEQFVTRKITKYVAKLQHFRKSVDGLKAIGDGINQTPYPKLQLGNLKAARDWGYAPDYVEGMWMMLQQEKPDDYVLATGETHSVEDFVREAFLCIGIKNWEKYVEVNPEFYRPCEVEFLCGSAAKAKNKLGWEPATKFAELVKKMVEYDAQGL